MTAINTTIQASPVFSSPASSVAAVRSGGAQASAPVVAEQVSRQSPGGQPSVRDPSVRDVEQAVKQANASIQGSNESITFGYEEKLGELVVQVSDKATGKVIQQLPSKDFIQFQLHMRAMIGLFLDKKA